MKTSQQANNKFVYVFGDFRLDPAQWTLVRGDEHLRIEPKIFDLLLFLVERRGQVVSKSELLQHLWPGVVVEEVALPRNISRLRALLDDQPPFRYIETARSEGYVFVADVEVQTAEARAHVHPNQSSEPRRRNSPSPLQVFSSLTLLLVVGLVVWVLTHNRKSEYSIKQLTSYSDELPIDSAALSQDGKKIAYTQRSRLYVAPYTMNERVEAILPPGLVPVRLQWFPDDMSLLVDVVDASSAEPSLLKFFVMSRSVSLVARHAAQAAVSGDGKTIAFLRGDCELWAADSDGSSPRLLRSLRETCPLGRIFFVGNDKKIVFGYHLLKESRSVLALYDIQTQQIKSTKLETLTSTVARKDDNTAWVSFWDGPGGAGSVLALVDINPAHASFGQSIKIEQWNDKHIGFISASADGEHALLLTERRHSDVFVLDTTSSTGAILTRNVASDRPASWLDYQTVLFYSDRNGKYGIYKQQLDSPEATPVVVDQSHNFRPAMSADHQWLFYFSQPGDDIDSPASLMRRSLQNTNTVSLRSVSPVNNQFRCALRANVCVLSELKDDKLVFYKLDTAQTTFVQVAQVTWKRTRSIYDWDVSPDGLAIAYVDAPHGSDRIAILSTNQSSQSVRYIVPQIITPLQTLGWDSQGGGFFVSSYLNDMGLLARRIHVAMDGSTTTIDTVPADVDGWMIAAPDGKHLACQVYTYSNNLWYVDRDISNNKRAGTH